MTFIGKLLAVVNLIVGIGIVTWSVSVYAFRPGAFDPVPDSVEKGHSPENFATYKQETEALARTADVASGLWGTNLKALEQAEDRRDKRRAEYAKRSEWARKGNPAKGGAAFFETVYEKDAAGKATSVVDIATLGPAVKGADNLPLKGTDLLLTNFSADVREVERLSQLITKDRKKYEDLSAEVVREDARLLKMLEIRDSVQDEAFHLGAFELNVYETRQTVFNRKRQLVLRLAELGVNVK